MTAQSSIVNPKSKIKLYWPLIKSSQTGLLLATGIAGYLSAGTRIGLLTLLGMSFSLFLAISGSTIMNMWYDRDIDAKMKRTHKRSAASGELNHTRSILGRHDNFDTWHWLGINHCSPLRSRGFCRLVLRCGHLHPLAQTPHRMEHCLGRHFGRDAHSRGACPRHRSH